MAVILGRDATIKVATDTVLEMVNWNLEITADAIVEPVFGDTWDKVHGLSTTRWTATADGLRDPSDTTGQQVFHNAVVSGTKLTTVRFYEDATNYWTPDTGSEASAGCYVTGAPIAVAQGDVGRVTFSFQGSGPIFRTT